MCGVGGRVRMGMSELAAHSRVDSGQSRTRAVYRCDPSSHVRDPTPRSSCPSTTDGPRAPAGDTQRPISAPPRKADRRGGRFQRTCTGDTPSAATSPPPRRPPRPPLPLGPPLRRAPRCAPAPSRPAWCPSVPCVCARRPECIERDNRRGAVYLGRRRGASMHGIEGCLMSMPGLRKQAGAVDCHNRPIRTRRNRDGVAAALRLVACVGFLLERRVQV